MSWGKRMDPSLVRLFGYLLQYKGKIAVACIFLMGTASTSSITATLLGKLTDLGFYQEASWVIVAAPIALVGISLMFAVCTVMGAYVMARVSQGILVQLRTELFDKILRWPAGHYQEYTTGLVSSKFVNEAAMALSGATQSVIVLVRDSVQVAALMGVLFWHNWQLTLLTFLVAPGLILILRTISKRMRVIVKTSQETLAQMISRVQESYSAQRVVKISDTYDFEDQRFALVNEKIKRYALKGTKMQSLATPLTQMLTMVAVAFVVGVALFEAQKGLLTIGEFITFLSAMLLMKAPIQHLAGLNATVASISVAAKSIFDMMDAKLEPDHGVESIERARGEMVFDDVCLRYPGQQKNALHHFSLRVAPGEHIALVGTSGAGKTSIINLIPRFWEVTSGSISLDGHDIRNLTLESLRRQIAIVSQDVVLFDDTIGNNIAYGCADVTPERMRNAIEAAALTDFVDALLNGLDTRVGEAGNLLSGGQKQRLSIARALLKDAPILILDEATSALDSESESAVKTALKNLTAGRTTFTIAHRLSTIEDSDRIVVMGDGEIQEMGTHAELIALEGGIYRNLCALQGMHS